MRVLLLGLWLCLSACLTESGLQVRTLVDGRNLTLKTQSQTVPRKGWQPGGLAVGQEGQIYVSDVENHRILHITATGVVTVLTGSGQAGWQDGPAEQARFERPQDLLLTPQGGLLVADTGNRCLRHISPQGQVSTLKTTADLKLQGPQSLALGNHSELFLSDAPSSRILAVGQTPALRVQLPPGVLPSSLHIDDHGQLLWADLQGIWRLNPAGQREWLLPLQRELQRIGDFLSDGQGGYFITDAYLHRLVHWQPGKPLRIIAGGPLPGHHDGPGPSARFHFPTALARGPAGEIYLADTRNSRICRVRIQAAGPAEVSTLARSGTQGFGERPNQEDLSLPHGIVYDPRQDAMLVSDYLHHRLMRIQRDGQALPWLTPEALPGEPLVLPAGLALGPDGSLYISSSGRHRIHKVSPSGKIQILAGEGRPGFKDGQGKAAAFYLPFGLAVGPDHTVYVADQGNHAIRAISPEGHVRTLAGNGQAGAQEGKGADARFYYPSGIAWHPQGYLLVADSWNHRICKLTLDGQVSTLIGSPASLHPLEVEDGLYVPEGLAVTPAGEVLIADSWNHRIRAWKPGSGLRTLAGSGRFWSFNQGFMDGRGAQARFNQPKALSLGPEGSLLVADTGNHSIRILTP